MDRGSLASPDYPIQPKDINAEGALIDCFGNLESEVSAGWVIRFLQERGAGWVPFTYNEINGYYEANSNSKDSASTGSSNQRWFRQALLALLPGFMIH